MLPLTCEILSLVQTLFAEGLFAAVAVEVAELACCCSGGVAGGAVCAWQTRLKEEASRITIKGQRSIKTLPSRRMRLVLLNPFYWKKFCGDPICSEDCLVRYGP